MKGTDVLNTLPPDAVAEARAAFPARVPTIDEHDTFEDLGEPADAVDAIDPGSDPEPTAVLRVVRSVRNAPVPLSVRAVETERSVLGYAAQRALAGPRTMFAKTGNWMLDDATGGIEPGLTWCVAGQSGFGKSTLASAIADENLGVRKILIGSTEDVSRIYGARIICRRTHVNAKRFKRGMLRTHEKHAVRECIGASRDLPLFIDWNGVTAEQIARDIVRLVAEHGIEIVLLDWLQKIPTEKRCADPRERVWHAFDCASRTCKQAGVALVVFSQITPTQGVPCMDWIRDSKDVAMLSDVVVMGLCKDERDDMGGLLSRERKFLVAKVKDDEAGACLLTGWENESASFQPVIRRTQDEPPKDYAEDPTTRDLYDFNDSRAGE